MWWLWMPPSCHLVKKIIFHKATFIIFNKFEYDFIISTQKRNWRPSKGKYVPDHLVSKFLKNGFMETPDITNEKAAEHFFQKKLGDAQTQLRSEAQKLADEKEAFEKLKAEFFANQNNSTQTEVTKIDGRSKEAKAKQV